MKVNGEMASTMATELCCTPKGVVTLVSQRHNGQRSGRRIFMYDGNFCYDRWEGRCEDDVPHGTGMMYLAAVAHRDSANTGPRPSTEGVAFEFAHGTPVTRKEK